MADYISLIDNYRNRVRIKIRNSKEIMRIENQWGQRKTSIMFEITNIGKYITSLEPEIFFTGYEPEGRKIYGVFEINDISRDLHPHISKNIQATIKEDVEKFEFLWFKTYTFTLTRGRKKRIRYDSAEMNILSYWKYVYKLFMFKFFKCL